MKINQIRPELRDRVYNLIDITEFMVIHIHRSHSKITQRSGVEMTWFLMEGVLSHITTAASFSRRMGTLSLKLKFNAGNAVEGVILIMRKIIEHSKIQFIYNITLLASQKGKQRYVIVE